MKKRFTVYVLVLGTLLCGIPALADAAEEGIPSPTPYFVPIGRWAPTPTPTPAIAPDTTPQPGNAVNTPKGAASVRTPTPSPTAGQPTVPFDSNAANALPGYASRYAAFAAKNPDYSAQAVRMMVNLKLDEGNYQNITTVPSPGSLDVFVSKHYGLPKSYKPENLVSVSRTYAQSGVRLRKDCYEAFLQMAQAMEQEGLTLYIKSGYRTNRKRGGPNDLWYAWPGHSEHQTGLAFDLRKKNVTYSTLGEYKYHKTAEYDWLCQHAHEYGFILSYPNGKSGITGIGYEPWHWRYIGVTIATDMKEKGIATYHEYWATYMIQKVYQ